MPAENPREEYAPRLKNARKRLQELEQRERRVGYVQLLVSAVAVIWVLWLLKHWSRSGFFVILVIAIFVVLAVVQDRLIQAVRHCSRVVRYYERGMERLDHRWAGTGESGEHLVGDSHPYARDLDLFGKASLFELLCTARTRAGEETLAKWLLAAAPVEEVLRRQIALLDLKKRVDFRERLWTLADGFRAGVRPEHLSAWGEQQPIFEARTMRAAAPVLAALWLVSFIYWMFCLFVSLAPSAATGLGRITFVYSGVRSDVLFVVLMTLLNLLLSQKYRLRAKERERAIKDAGHDLELLAEVLAAFEEEQFTSPKLVELQAKLRREGISPSVAIARLNGRLELLESGHNLVVKLIDPVCFWNLQFVLAIEAWRKRFGPAIREWIEAVGELEALLALAGYAYEHPADVFPEFVDSGACFHAADFHAEGLAHPLLPLDKAVRNDLELGREIQVVILSGPNMAGKSTLLRGIGVNAVLAQCGAPVRAERLQLSALAVTASICVLDSLEGGVSRFYAEIQRLKQIMDLTRGPLPVLFLLDELLSGTNSHDRLIGTRSVVAKLMEHGAVGLVTTHDLALTRIPESLGSRAINCHFADQLSDGKLSFDYKLSPGVVQTSNALQLMRSIGLEI